MERIPKDSKYSSNSTNSSSKSSEENSLDKIFEENYNRRINFVNSGNSTSTSQEQISSSSEQQLEQKKQYQLNILSDRELIILQKVEEKLGRPLDNLETIDTIEYILYEPDRVKNWLEGDTELIENTKLIENAELIESTEPTEQIAIETQPIQPIVKEETQSNSLEKVINMSSLEKITRTIERAIFYLPYEKGNKLKALLSSKTLVGLLAIISTWSVSQFIGIGEIIDIGVIFLGGTFLGWNAITIFKNAIGFANSINATTEEDLDVAARHLVKIVLTIEIDSLVIFFKKNALRKEINN